MDRSAYAISGRIQKFIEENKLDIPKIFIDIGANNGWHESNSHLFIVDYNYFGHLIEPNSNLNLALHNIFAGKNYKISNIAISNIDNDNGSLYSHDHNDAFGNEQASPRTWAGQGNSIIKNNSNKCINCVIKSYSTYCKENNINEIGIVSIDTEGHEKEIIQNIIESKILPNFLIIETHNLIGFEEILAPIGYKKLFETDNKLHEIYFKL